ncbi:MAG: hypothetical protein KA325_04120 [Flavobacterium sp.]|nr:hypothetical protein [Flavobacterium sp.]
MKAKLIKLGFLTYLLLTNFILFAKDNGGDILDDGNVENAEPPVAPINNVIIIFVIISLVFAFYLYKTKKVKA